MNGIEQITAEIDRLLRLQDDVPERKPVLCVVCGEPIRETGTALDGDSSKPCHISCFHSMRSIGA